MFSTHSWEIVWFAASILVALIAASFIVKAKVARRLTRSSSIVPLLVVALSAASGAYAWSVLTGGSGSTGGKITTASITNAVNIEQPTDASIDTFCQSSNPSVSCSKNQPGSEPQAVDPGSGASVDVFFGIKNLSGVAENITIDPTKVTFTGTGSSGGNCGAHLHLSALSSPTNTSGQAVPKTADTTNGWYDDGNGGVILGYKAALSADSGMPVDCSNATFTINVPSAAVTTQP